jgi:hypothetical protein
MHYGHEPPDHTTAYTMPTSISISGSSKSTFGLVHIINETKRLDTCRTQHISIFGTSKPWAVFCLKRASFTT